MDTDAERSARSWTQPLRRWRLLFALVMLGLAAVMGFAVCRTLGEQSAGGSVGLGAGCFLIVATAFLLCRDSGFARIRTSRRIRIVDDKYGPGVQVPTERLSMVVLGFVLAATSLYCILIWVLWTDGRADELLTPGRNNSGGAVIALVYGCVAGVLLLLGLLSDTTSVVTIYREGLRRKHNFKIVGIPRRSDVFVPWDAIDSVVRNERIVNTGKGPRRDAEILVHHHAELGTPAVLDADGCLVVSVSRLVAEPNTLFSVIDDMYRNPERRELLAGADARALFTPPPLRERWRRARAHS
ncbi:hypothetical protein [Rhodococcus sp. HNM0569]|uniref:hypothetical protein n=1 Tax=Rhodococcus sp. HNM0569 TaxID=2716340 RepID=UPI00146E3D26|nr:hypothetical protein [Rhodococcus sp. HNM0569]NLU82719.1 hypothetical protein [Rhodococcus sp. HNM0569]